MKFKETEKRTREMYKYTCTIQAICACVVKAREKNLRPWVETVCMYVCTELYQLAAGSTGGKRGGKARGRGCGCGATTASDTGTL
jgi:hypothetical protein